MAATVDYNNPNPEKGIYGAYNNFVAMIDTDTSNPKNLTYEVTVSALNDGTTATRSVSPIGTTAIVEVFKLMQDSFFKTEYNGFTEHVQIYGFSKVDVTVQEYSSTSNDTPPTPTGSPVTNRFYVYNGYEEQPVALNYRDPSWYNTTPIKLPKVKKEIFTLPDDVELLTFPSDMERIDGDYEAKYLMVTFYDSDGSVVSSFDIDLRSPQRSIALNSFGYWNVNINAFFFPDGAVYSTSKIRYETFDGESYPYVDSELITNFRAKCSPKNERYRLYWVNRYGGAEYQNFTLAASTKYMSKKGKRIQSDGINYAASNFAEIKNINNPNIQEFGGSVTKEITIRSDYFTTQGEIDSMAEVLKSPALIMFDDDNTAHPMVLKNTNYDRDLLTEGLVKMELTLEYANNEFKQIK